LLGTTAGEAAGEGPLATTAGEGELAAAGELAGEGEPAATGELAGAGFAAAVPGTAVDAPVPGLWAGWQPETATSVTRPIASARPAILERTCIWLLLHRSWMSMTATVE
jgi:hypothetical protein